jgi:hypothetical protein
MTDAPKRGWFRFSIRELALLVLAVGLALGWYRERQAAAPFWNCVKQARDRLAGSRSNNTATILMQLPDTSETLSVSTSVFFVDDRMDRLQQKRAR